MFGYNHHVVGARPHLALTLVVHRMCAAIMGLDTVFWRFPQTPPIPSPAASHNKPKHTKKTQPHTLFVVGVVLLPLTFIILILFFFLVILALNGSRENNFLKNYCFLWHFVCVSSSSKRQLNSNSLRSVGVRYNGFCENMHSPLRHNKAEGSALRGRRSPRVLSRREYYSRPFHNARCCEASLGFQQRQRHANDLQRKTGVFNFWNLCWDVCFAFSFLVGWCSALWIVDFHRNVVMFVIM